MRMEFTWKKNVGVIVQRGSSKKKGKKVGDCKSNRVEKGKRATHGILGVGVDVFFYVFQTQEIMEKVVLIRQCNQSRFQWLETRD
jgi:hypothetical protein